MTTQRYPSLPGLDNLSVDATGAIRFAGVPIPFDQERIAENQRVLQGWWDGKPVSRPIVLSQPRAAAQLRLITEDIDGTPVRYMLHEPQVLQQLRANKRVMAAGCVTVPEVASDFNLWLMASVFGATIVAPEDSTDPGSLWAEPVYSTLQEMADMRVPDLQSGLLPTCLAETRQLRARLPDYVKVGVRMNDGPLSVACHLCGMETLLITMLDAPDVAHHVLDVTTETWIAVRTAIEAAAGYAAYRPGEVRPDVPVHAPCCGAMICDDAMAVLSPAQYRELVLPYHQRILRRFGGGVIHSCGRIMHLLPALATLPELDGVEFGQGQQNDLDPAREQLGDKVMVFWGWPEILDDATTTGTVRRLLSLPRTAIYSSDSHLITILDSL